LNAKYNTDRSLFDTRDVTARDPIYIDVCVARSVRKLGRAVTARLAERASTKISIALIIVVIVVGASSRLAALSVNTKTPISFIWALREKREHSEEGYSRGASLLGVGTGAPSVNAVPAL
jgi:hypothetical protein